MHFKSAYLKLILFYVLIVMIISIGFSVVLYRLSFVELGRGLNRQTRILRELPGDVFRPPQIEKFEDIRRQQLQESNQRLKIKLIYFNLLILLLSSGLSYFLARRTLRPIENMVLAQNRFTADASHELKTPLAAMRSEIEVNLRDKQLNLLTTKNLLKSNLEEIAKLETLSNALLRLARYQEEAKLTFKDLSLSEIIAASFEKIENLALKKNIKIENKISDLKIKGDKDSLAELFVILLDNAIKYSPKNSKVNIATKEDRNHVIVSIKDEGIGIKQSDLPFIFNRFYRADHSRSKEKADGYGLGLSIAKQIVGLHQGKISAKSKPDKGSEFIVKLPK